MLDRLIEKIKNETGSRDNIINLFKEHSIPSKTLLLSEGELATKLFFVKKGCLRMWFNKDGRDITLQFFFENQAVASVDSFFSNMPSMFSIESIEPSTIIVIKKEDFEVLHAQYPELKDGFQQYIFHRFRNYAQLFLSRIKDTPQERYLDLLANHPEIIKRVPQHYIASYLGITAISLSRIRNRK